MFLIVQKVAKPLFNLYQAYNWVQYPCIFYISINEEDFHL